jgi:hypothetical protein
MSVVEVTTFRLRPGGEDAEFLELDRRVQTEFIPNHPGFLRRTTARAADGTWAVITLWAGEEEAERSAVLAVDDPVMGAFMASVEPTSLRSDRYHTLD